MNEIHPIPGYESYSHSYSRSQLENEAKNALLLKLAKSETNENKKSTASVLRLAPAAIIISALLMSVFK